MTKNASPTKLIPKKFKLEAIRLMEQSERPARLFYGADQRLDSITIMVYIVDKITAHGTGLPICSTVVP